MKRRVFRGHVMGTMIGLLFGGAGLTFAIGIALTAPTEGILVNDVRRYDVGPILGAIAFCSLFVLLGAALVAGSVVARVVTDDGGLRIHNFVNRVTFQAAWPDLKRLSWENGKLDQWGWRIFAGDQTVDLPSPGSPADLYRQILSQAPRVQVIGQARPEPTSDRLDEIIDAPLRNSRDLSTMIFSVPWYAFLIFCAFGLFTQSHPSKASDWIFAYLIAPVFILGFAGVFWPMANTAWDRYLFGRVDIGPAGLTVRNRRGSTTIAWSHLRLVQQEVFRDDQRSERSLSLITNESAVTYRDHWPHYRLVRAHAIADAPAIAVFVGF